jgi:hypothetical protein
MGKKSILYACQHMTTGDILLNNLEKTSSDTVVPSLASIMKKTSN